MEVLECISGGGKGFLEMTLKREAIKENIKIIFYIKLLNAYASNVKVMTKYKIVKKKSAVSMTHKML
jgi:hypothetical protein